MPCMRMDPCEFNKINCGDAVSLSAYFPPQVFVLTPLQYLGLSGDSVSGSNSTVSVREVKVRQAGARNGPPLVMGCPGLRDPPHPNCAPTAEGARFALALHGSVSGRRWNTMAGQLMHFPTDLPSSVFVNLNVSYTDLARNVMRPSGGRHLFDTFMHSTVQSSEARSKLLELYQPVASLFYSNYQEGVRVAVGWG